MSAARVLFCGVGFGHGGLASSFPPVAAALERRGFEVKVLVPHAADRGALDLPPGYETGPAFRWRVRSIWAGRLLRLFHLATFGRLRFLFARQVPHDAFVVYGASCCMEWCGYSSKPTWAFLHSEPEIGLSGPLRPAIVRDLHRSAARAQRVFAVSNAVHDAWLKLGIDSEVLRLPRACKSSSAAAARDPRRCVYVGRLSWEKGVDRLLDAIARVPGLSLDVVGDGPLRRDLERRAVALGVAGRVRFLGWQDDPAPFLAVAGLAASPSRSEGLSLSILDAGLAASPSRSEGLSLSILEALEAGVPVLATDIPGSREALAGGRYGRLVPDSVDGLAAALAEFVRNPRSCDPAVGFETVRAELSAMSAESERRLAEIAFAFPRS